MKKSLSEEIMNKLELISILKNQADLSKAEAVTVVDLSNPRNCRFSKPGRN
jgi:hypothetical protein